MGTTRKLTGAQSLLDDESFNEAARRRSDRESSHANVDFVEPVEAEGVALNISEGGMRVAVYQEIPADQDCIIKIWLTEDHHVCRRARIVWSKEAADGWVLGLKFEEEHEDDEASSSVQFSPIIECNDNEADDSEDAEDADDVESSDDSEDADDVESSDDSEDANDVESSEESEESDEPDTSGSPSSKQ